MKKRTLAHENDWYYNNYIMRLLIVEDENDLRNIVKKKACQGTLQCRCLWGWSGSDGLYRYDFLRWYYS